MGLKTKEAHPQFASHESYYEQYKKVSDIMIVENVVEYGSAITKERLGPEREVQSLCVDPRNFGLGVARARIYMLCWNTKRVRWDSPLTLAELLDAVASRRVLTAKNYFWQRRPCSLLSDAEDPWLQRMLCVPQPLSAALKSVFQR